VYYAQRPGITQTSSAENGSMEYSDKVTTRQNLPLFRGLRRNTRKKLIVEHGRNRIND